MKLIIDIDDNVFTRLFDNGVDTSSEDRKIIDRAVRNGKPYEEKPQGEWIKEPNGKTTDLYRCSVCNRNIMLCKGADLTKYPFCHCGADMRGGTQ